MAAILFNSSSFSTRYNLANSCRSRWGRLTSIAAVIRGTHPKLHLPEITLKIYYAQVAIKARDSQIRLFYLRIRSRRGHKIALVATSKKLLKIIWHLLVTGEEYVDKHYEKKTITKSSKKTLKLTLEEAIPLPRQAEHTTTRPR
jgi:hypothetical protein